MSHKVIDLRLEHGDEGLCYTSGELVLVAAKQRSRWQVQIRNSDLILGTDVLNLADASRRRALIRSLRSLEEGDDLRIDRLLIAISTRVDADWTEHLRQQDQAALEDSVATSFLRDQAAEQARSQRLEALKPSIEPLMRDPALLFRVAEAISAQGLVGERGNGLLLYLALTSRLLETPISVVIKGDSSGGQELPGQGRPQPHPRRRAPRSDLTLRASAHLRPAALQPQDDRHL